ncbi:MAG TPA: cytidine deaminase [Prevotella sp.]|nr:cytidine deaminase [Prevotella sp.]
MEKVNVSSDIRLCQIEELVDEDKELVQTAIQATDNSYSPYSKFRVGAAVRLAGGKVIKGANQENAAFPVTICAERSAIFAAQANYPDKAILSIAIAARNEEGFTQEPVSPCGSCRQVMVEIEQKYSQPLHILLYGKKGVYVMDSIRNLMPLSFTDLK